MTTAQLAELCNEVQTIARETGAFIRAQRKTLNASQIESKGKNNFVTAVDKASEEMLVTRLGALFPAAGFITEEDDTRIRHAEWNWIIDPLDGTSNFIHGIPCYAVSIALAQHDIPVLGVIYEVNLDECFSAVKDHGAYLNGQSIYVSATQQLSESLVATGFPYDIGAQKKMYLDLFSTMLEHSRGIRRIGSAAVDMAYVACGRFDAFYEQGLNSWDVAAGTVIVQEAGGAVCDFEGGENFLFGKTLVCGTAAVTDAIVAITKTS